MQKVRFAIIVCDKKKTRYIVASTTATEYALLIKRQWVEDDFSSSDNYSLYANALTLEQVDEIFTLVSNKKTRTAVSIIKKAISNSDSIIDDVGPVMLDDYIPDDWYDAWKEMEFFITSDKDLPGFYKHDVRTIYEY